VDAANAQRISHEEEKARGAKTAQNAEWIRGIAEANAARRTDKERLAGGAGHVAREGAELAPSVPVVARRETDEAAVKADITLRLAEAGRKAEGEHRAREVERAAHEERQRAMSASSSWNPYKEIQTTFRGHPVRVKNTLTRCVLYIDGEEVDRSKGLVSRDKNAPVLGGTINIDNIFHFVEVYAFSEALKVKIKLCIDGEFVTGDYF
jgi:hypothetical protein